MYCLSVQEACLGAGSAYVIVYSVADRSSFEAAAELRITLRRARQNERLPIILVGNKSDLVRAREVNTQGTGSHIVIVLVLWNSCKGTGNSSYCFISLKISEV